MLYLRRMATPPRDSSLGLERCLLVRIAGVSLGTWGCNAIRYLTHGRLVISTPWWKAIMYVGSSEYCILTELKLYIFSWIVYRLHIEARKSSRITKFNETLILFTIFAFKNPNLFFLCASAQFIQKHDQVNKINPFNQPTSFLPHFTTPRIPSKQSGRKQDKKSMNKTRQDHLWPPLKSRETYC